MAGVGLVVGATWVALTSRDAGDDTTVGVEPVAAQVQLESTSAAGNSPFMTPVGQDQPGVTPPAGTSGQFAGDTPGLFAEDPDRPSCDGQGLTGNLQADPPKAAAWAQPLGISAADIPGFVATLHPVVLRSDTAVTSYGYTNGSFNAYPAVLQAGTAVFVNSFGEPTVKCFSGNPLTKALDYSRASYVGPRWGYFAPASLTYVLPTPVVIKRYTYVDWHGGFHQRASWCAEHPGSDKCRQNPPPKPLPKPLPEPAPKPDPVLQQKAADAAAKAAEAAKIATDARAKADDAATAQRIFETEARNDAQAVQESATKTTAANAARAQAANALLLAQQDAAAHPGAVTAAKLAAAQAALVARTAESQAAAAAAADLQKKAAASAAAAQEKANQAKNAEAAARSAEGTQKFADQAAKDAADAAAGKAAAEQADGKPPAQKVPDLGKANTLTADQQLVGPQPTPGSVPTQVGQPTPGTVPTKLLQPTPAPSPAALPTPGTVPSPVVQPTPGSVPSKVAKPEIAGDPCASTPRAPGCASQPKPEIGSGASDQTAEDGGSGESSDTGDGGSGEDQGDGS
ncbi:DUF6777 domain-containing protein [Pseudonocardia spinosispora]|uniref:DUF6777 domain-containing protein n=1 Tax=Pseudonocardia spinosispora TaxID=103441 RepID=UPI00040595E7|nr:DUF6777 domain-containing protein [Pseudonocardia spinosispora]